MRRYQHKKIIVLDPSRRSGKLEIPAVELPGGYLILGAGRRESVVVAGAGHGDCWEYVGMCLLE